MRGTERPPRPAGYCLARGRIDAPAGSGRARRGVGTRRSQQQGGDSLGLGGELQPPALGQGQPIDLGERGGEPGTAQRLLERPQTRVAGARPDHDQALRREAQLGEARGEQLVPRPDPDHVAAIRHQPAEQRRSEAQRGPLVRRAAQLVQTAARQYAAGQGAIYPGQPEREDRAAAPAHRFQPAEPGAQPLEHGSPGGRRGCAIDVAGLR